jgi:DNA invertase Pin-like site-specific DNA recombinase
MNSTSLLFGSVFDNAAAGLRKFEGSSASLFRARTGEGRARAVKNGVKFGREPKLNPTLDPRGRPETADGESLTDIARNFNVNHSTIMRIVAAVEHAGQRGA